MNITEIRELLSKATPRPWCWAHIYDGENVIQGEPSEHVAIVETEADTGLIVELVNNADELLAEVERLRKGLHAVELLIGESYGVAGLHLNGDIAFWGELRSGGRLEEWLRDFDAALEQKP